MAEKRWDNRCVEEDPEEGECVLPVARPGPHTDGFGALRRHSVLSLQQTDDVVRTCWGKRSVCIINKRINREEIISIYFLSQTFRKLNFHHQ